MMSLRGIGLFSQKLALVAPQNLTIYKTAKVNDRSEQGEKPVKDLSN